MQVPQPEPAEGVSAFEGGKIAGGTAIATEVQPPPAESNHRWGFGAFFLAEAVFILASVTLAAIFGSPGRVPGSTWRSR